MTAKFMQKLPIALLIVGVVIALILLANGGWANPLLVRSGLIRVESHVDYAALPFDELVKT